MEICAKDFKATASMRGIGWVISYQDIESGLLFNQWINEHDVGHPAGLNPLLVLDVFEHAFITDYGLKRADYIGAFFKNVKWDVVEKRFVREEFPPATRGQGPPGPWPPAPNSLYNDQSRGLPSV